MPYDSPNMKPRTSAFPFGSGLSAASDGLVPLATCTVLPQRTSMCACGYVCSYLCLFAHVTCDTYLQLALTGMCFPYMCAGWEQQVLVLQMQVACLTPSDSQPGVVR
eukprot:m.79323 g.79323  ORF g.79323 m.79323 type:complete len:107 (+) comp16268_c0_seq3:565-885(+)